MTGPVTHGFVGKGGKPITISNKKPQMMNVSKLYNELETFKRQSYLTQHPALPKQIPLKKGSSGPKKMFLGNYSTSSKLPQYLPSEMGQLSTNDHRASRNKIRAIAASS